MKDVLLGGAITIRQVTSMDKKLEVRDLMKKRYAYKNYPDEFSYRCKCIVVFQNLDGVDVILFGLYVYEHDEKNPYPNKRCVYVSYLDSVHYMRPRQMRTFIYHEILISYLDYVRKRGYATAHIWACPPLKGDDYILYAKPEDQKTPKDERLRQWYLDMLVDCQKRGIVGKVTNMYDLYFANKKNDATVVPYMDGDYFPAEVENIIKNIEEGKTGKKGVAQGQKKKKGDKDKSKKKKSGRGGTRSTGIDEDALKASGIMTEGKDQKSLEEGGRDYVMVKLGETIQPMKESFLVAYLAWEGATKEELEVPKVIQEYRENNGENLVEVIANEKESSDTPNEKESTGTPMEVDETKEVEVEQDPENETSAETPKPEAGTSPAQPSAPENASPDVAMDPANSKTKDSPEKKDSSKTGDSPKETEDSPTETEVSSKETEVSPKETEVSPKETEVSPKETEVSPKETEDSPKEMDDSPIKTEGSPKKTEGSTKKTEGLPKTPVKNEPFEDKKNGESSAGSPVSAPDASDSNSSAKPTSDAEAQPKPGAPPTSTSSPQKAVPAPPSAEKPKQLSVEERSGKFAAMARKRGREEEEKKEKEEKKDDAPTTTYVTDSKGRRVKVIDDDAEEMDCEFLNNRQAFLNLCQGNHYQYDQLRRAKHSSMMVLWHLHNRDAPKFVQQCTTCSREILQGYRYHCPTCADFDQCEDCVRNPKTPRHPHQLKAIPVTNAQQTELTEAQRKERQRSIQLHMTLLLHAATCQNSKCPSANCQKMKGLLKHGAECKQKATGGCNVCKRIWALLQIHARQCKQTSCPVPNCMAIRERVRQLKLQQQAMDDRRRQQMNQSYRMGAR
jgi:hypothetical protein